MTSLLGHARQTPDAHTGPEPAGDDLTPAGGDEVDGRGAGTGAPDAGAPAGGGGPTGRRTDADVPEWRAEGVTLFIAGSSPGGVGPLSLSADGAGITFWGREEGQAHTLPWHRITTVTVSVGGGGAGDEFAAHEPGAHLAGVDDMADGEMAGAGVTAELELHTERRAYRVLLPGWDPDRLVEALGPLVPGSTQLLPPAAPDGSPAPAAGHPETVDRVLAPVDGHPETDDGHPDIHGPPKPTPVGVTDLEPGDAEGRHRRAIGRHLAIWASSARFDRLRPVLAVLLMVAVATMVALVLAASAGAIHLSWLGGSSPVPSTPAPLHR